MIDRTTLGDETVAQRIEELLNHVESRDGVRRLEEERSSDTGG